MLINMIDTACLPALLTHAGIIAFAVMVHGTIGIGFPLIATPLLVLVSDERTAILLLLVLPTVINIADILPKHIKGGENGSNDQDRGNRLVRRFGAIGYYDG